MPCAQSLVSEMMGEMAAWMRCRSISSAICSSEPRTTASVTGSMVIGLASALRASGLIRTRGGPSSSRDLHQQISAFIDARDHAGLDDGRRVVLLDDRGPCEAHAGEQVLACVDGRVVPAAEVHGP